MSIGLPSADVCKHNCDAQASYRTFLPILSFPDVEPRARSQRSKVKTGTSRAAYGLAQRTKQTESSRTVAAPILQWLCLHLLAGLGCPRCGVSGPVGGLLLIETFLQTPVDRSRVMIKKGAIRKHFGDQALRSPSSDPGTGKCRDRIIDAVIK